MIREGSASGILLNSKMLTMAPAIVDAINLPPTELYKIIAIEGIFTALN
jgi:hypothetical protein